MYLATRQRTCIERRSPCEGTLSQHQPLIILIIALLCFWGRDYLTAQERGNLRNNIQYIRREVEIALPSWDDALATILSLYDFAIAFLSGEDEAKTVEDTVKNIKNEIEKLRSVCRKDGQNSESKQRDINDGQGQVQHFQIMKAKKWRHPVPILELNKNAWKSIFELSDHLNVHIALVNSIEAQ